MNKQYPIPNSSAPGSGGGGGSGTVTSVGMTINGTSPSGIFTVTGSPVTTAGTLNANLAGTSGGVPYFSSGTVLSSSGQLASTGVVLGGGAGTTPSTSTQLTFVPPTLTIGLAGTSSGILALTGSTSGTATLTSPAIAGTTTNPVVSSNVIQVPGLSVGGQTINNPPLNYFGQCSGAAGSAIHTCPSNLGANVQVSVACNTVQTPTSVAFGSLITHSCNLKNLVATSSTTGTSASDGVITVFLGSSTSAASTTLTCTIGTGLSCTDTTHSVSATAGQRVLVDILTATSSTLTSVAVAFDCM